MSEERPDYSQYMSYHSHSTTTYALSSGFIFTAIAIILTQYPLVAQLHAQVTLFILSFMLDLFLYLLYSEAILLSNCVQIAPPITWYRLRHTEQIESMSWMILGLVAVLMFFIWGLTYLALASAIVAIAFALDAYYMLLKPFQNYRKEHPWVRK